MTIKEWPPDWPEAVSPLEIQEELSALLTILCGFILLFLGLFQLGWIVNFISQPVLTGFINAAAISIPAGQIHKLFGFEKKFTFNHPSSFFENFKEQKINTFDMAIGLTTIFLMYFFDYLKTFLAKNTKIAENTKNKLSLALSGRAAFIIGRLQQIYIFVTILYIIRIFTNNFFLQ